MRALLLAAALGAPALAQTAPAQPPANDFELLSPEKAPDPAEVARGKELSRELSRRRSMRQLHQLGGFVTLAAVAAPVVVGQLNYLDKYGGGGDTGRYIVLHRWMGIGTTTIFTATGLLAVLAPSPLPKQLRLDTATVHKVAMTVAAAGMLAQVILGPSPPPRRASFRSATSRSPTRSSATPRSPPPPRALRCSRSEVLRSTVSRRTP